jgi:hypothetical protein
MISYWNYNVRIYHLYLERLNTLYNATRTKQPWYFEILTRLVNNEIY